MTTRTDPAAGTLLCDICDRAADLDTGAWDAVWRKSGGSVFADPGFLRVVEESMSDNAICWHAIVREESGAPVATATFTLFRVDLAILATPGMKRVVERLRAMRPELLRIKVLFCGLPVSAGQSNLLMAPGADASAVLAVLDEAMLALARRHGAMLLCHKEMDDAGRTRFAGLVSLRWTFAEVPAMNRLDPGYADFDSYVGALRARRRQDVLRSVRKAARAGALIARVTDPDTIIGLYTDEVHDLYLAVVARSDHQLELLPKRFFHDLVRQFPGQVELVTATIDGKIAAFNWSLAADDVFHLLFCGIDYDLNPVADLYFNIMYAEMDRAFRTRMSGIHMGQTADTFKGRLGCRQEARFIAVKGRTIVTSRLLAATAKLLFPPPDQPPRYSIFRKIGMGTGRDPRPSPEG